MIVDQMQQAVSPIMERIHHLPFNIELAAGNLAEEKFLFYIVQDAIYLADFSKALAITAVKLPNNQLMQQFLTFAQEAITAERELHLNTIQSSSLKQTIIDQPTPACFMYTNYLLKMATMATVEESAASLLPCFWVYQEVAKKIAVSCHHTHHRYLAWIHFYTSQAFETSVQAAMDTVNQLGDASSTLVKQKMMQAFVMSTKLEWHFWHSAYHHETWLV
jgi:thiaminase (transcriptional activator TenA)